MMSWSSTYVIKGKWRNLGRILVKTWKRKQDEILGLFEEFLGNWQPDLPGEIGSKHKFKGVFFESVLLQSWRGLKILRIHIKWSKNGGCLPIQKPIGRCWSEVDLKQETLSALRQRILILFRLGTFLDFIYFRQSCR